MSHKYIQVTKNQGISVITSEKSNERDTLWDKEDQILRLFTESLKI